MLALLKSMVVVLTILLPMPPPMPPPLGATETWVLVAVVVAAIVLLLVKRSSTPAPTVAATVLPGPVQVQGRPLKCLVCGHDTFRTSAPAPGRADMAYTCAQCGYLHWFLPT